MQSNAAQKLPRRMVEKALRALRHPLQTLQLPTFLSVLRTQRSDLIVRRGDTAYRVADYLLANLLLGFNAYEYFRLLAYQNGWAYRNRCITTRRLNRIARRLNRRDQARYLNDKACFAQHWQAYFGRPCCCLPQSPRSVFCETFASCSRLMVKPLSGTGGRGIRIVDVEGDPDAVYDRLTREQEPLLVEAYMAQQGLLHEMNPSSLNSVRVITIRRDGRAEIVAATLRVGGAGEILDNLHAHGVGYTVDPCSGRVGRGIDAGGRCYSRHPGTGFPVEGSVIPGWERVRQLCCAAHLHAPQGLNLIGWDVCVSDDRLCLIEGNYYPGFPPPLDGKQDLWKAVRPYLRRDCRR